MSKYNTLWEFIKKSGKETLKLSFAEIGDIAGIKIDHSFLNYKKELEQYGYKVQKISLKEKAIAFAKISKSENIKKTK
jgi:hypothetical protein